MTWAEALRVLGITQEVDFKDVRRAYLKQIKVHKPEQDPEGFQRVREAFEMVGPVLQARERSSSATPPRGPTFVQPFTGASQVPAPATDADAPHANEIDSESRDAEIALPSPAAEEPRAYEAQGADSVDESDSAALAGAEQRIARWVQLVREQDLNTAASEALQSLKLATRFPFEVRLPGDLLLRLVGELAARGECIRARHLAEGVRAWLAALPSAREVLSSQGLPRWVLLDELVQAEQHVSAATYQALAKAIVVDGEDALKDLELRQILNPEQSRQDLFALIKSAPTVAKTFTQLLDPPAAAASPAGGSSGGYWRWSWLVIVLGLNAIRICTSSFSGDDQPQHSVRPAPPATEYASARCASSSDTGCSGQRQSRRSGSSAQNCLGNRRRRVPPRRRGECAAAR